MLRRGIFHHLEELHDVIQGLALGAVGLFGSVAQGDNGYDSLALGDSEQLSQLVDIAHTHDKRVESHGAGLQYQIAVAKTVVVGSPSVAHLVGLVALEES